MDEEFKILVPKDIPTPEQYNDGPGTAWYEEWKDLTPRESAKRHIGFLIAVAQGVADDSKVPIEQREEARKAGTFALIAYCNLARTADRLLIKNEEDDYFIKMCMLMGHAISIGLLGGARDIRAMDYFRPLIATETRKDGTRNAVESRRTISKIVMFHAEALWAKKSGFRGKAHRTAEDIRAKVSAEAACACDGNPLRGWPADEKIEVERIRKCIERALAKPVKVEGASD